jgi:hypothetical protein
MIHPPGADVPDQSGACSPVSLARVAFALLLSKLFFGSYARKLYHLPPFWAAVAELLPAGASPCRARQ